MGTDNTKINKLRLLFNWHDPLANGRLCMLLQSAFASIATNLTSGLFYTGFLSSHGINIVEIGILFFIPYIANIFSIFSPSILERFKRRRVILAVARASYFTLNILAVTAMPYIITDRVARMYAFIGIVFLSNIILALFSSGYPIWHLKFIPDEVRAEYFSTNALVNAVVGCGASLGASIAADALAGSAYEQKIIVLLRIIGYIIALLDVFVLCLPKEYDYEKSGDKPKFSDVFKKPLAHKSFIVSMVVISLYNFFVQVPASSLNYFLLNTIKAEYTLITAIDFVYPITLFLLLPLWKKILYRVGWFKTFAIGELLHVGTTLLYSCISPINYLWVLPTVRIAQHIFGVGRNLAASNLIYVNMPLEDRTNYMSFYTVVINLANFFGMMSGTSFVAAFPDLDINLFGLHFYNVQVLLWIQMIGQILVPLLVFKLLPILMKGESEPRQNIYVKKK